MNSKEYRFPMVRGKKYLKEQNNEEGRVRRGGEKKGRMGSGEGKEEKGK